MNANEPNPNDDLVAFASDLVLAPGHWPLLLDHEGRQFQRGVFTRDADGDVTSVLYHEQNKHTGSRTGAKLIVFND